MSENYTRNFNLTSRLNDTIRCVASKKLYHFVEISVDTATLTIQLFLVCAIIIYRRKLVQNLVNIYAANVAFGNFALSFFSTFSSYLGYIGQTREYDGYVKTYPGFRYFWLTIKTLKLVMFLVICLAIGLLILAVKNNVFRVHRTIAGMTRNSVQTLHKRDVMFSGKKQSLKYCSRLWIKKNPRTIAAIQIAIVWVVPILLSGFAFFKNSCIEECHCLINYLPEERSVMQCPPELDCNLLWPSFPNWSIIASCIFWFFCMISVFALFARSYYNFRQIRRQRKIAHKAQLRNSVIEAQRSEEVDATSDINDSQANCDFAIDGLKQETTTEQMRSWTLERSDKRRNEHRPSKNLLSESIKTNIFHTFILALIFIIGTGPGVLFTLYISFNPTLENFHKYNSLIIVPFLILPSITSLINSFFLFWSYQALTAVMHDLIRTILTCRLVRKKH